MGKGAFGKVNLALHVLTGRLVAIKSINKTKLLNVETTNVLILNVQSNAKGGATIKTYNANDTLSSTATMLTDVLSPDSLKSNPTYTTLFSQLISLCLHDCNAVKST